MTSNWDNYRQDAHRAAPGTLETTLRRHPDGRVVPAVWDDSGRLYVGHGADRGFKSERRAKKHAERLLKDAQIDFVNSNREVIGSVIVNLETYERHITGGEA